MNQKEKLAIKVLEAALSDCYKLGIRLTGLNNQLLYATKSALKRGELLAKETEEICGFCCSSFACAIQVGVPGTGTLDEECYEDSGGW